MVFLNLTQGKMIKKLKILDNPKNLAEKLFLYLFQNGKGISSFSVKYLLEDYHKKSKFKDRKGELILIETEIRKRLSVYMYQAKDQYVNFFMSNSNGDYMVFYILPDKSHSGWKHFFKNPSDAERVFNLVFSFYMESKKIKQDFISDYRKLFFDVDVFEQNKLLVQFNIDYTINPATEKDKILPKYANHSSGIPDFRLINGFGKRKKRNSTNTASKAVNTAQKEAVKDSQFEATKANYSKNMILQLALFLNRCNISFKKST